MPLAIVSSTSIPFIFPHRHLDGRILVDGGTAWKTNLISAIDRCMEVVDDESKIVIDVILCKGTKLTKEINTQNAVENYLRHIEIKNSY